MHIIQLIFHLTHVLFYSIGMPGGMGPGSMGPGAMGPGPMMSAGPPMGRPDMGQY